MRTEILERKIKESKARIKELATGMGIAESTLYRKLESGNFSVSEAQKITELLHLNASQAYEIFLTRNSRKY